ncbi:MAG TPA: sugar ABC transporter substrate-binding protein [Burkholderiales bacterium]|nr:sugar ABC transporter substrate-binding protein [Burkholderiales bacterium]
MLNLAVFTKNRSNPAYGAARLGAERTAQRLGASVTQYVPEKPDDVEEQIALIDQAIATKPDAIVLVPVHPTKINGALTRIVDAGIPLFGMLNEFNEPKPFVYVGADDVAIGVDIASYLYRHLGGRGDVVILEGASHSVTSRARVEGFRKALETFPGIRIAATICGDYLRDPAERATKALLATGATFDAVLTANDDMALGALRALDAAGRKCAVVGVNAIPEAVAAIREGRLLATADFNALAISELATEAAIRHLEGEKLPKEIILPVEVIDRNNCVAWDRPFEERPSLRWDEVVGA